MKFLKSGISLLSIVLLLASCLQSDYTKLVKAELAKGIRQDSLLFGIKFGDTRNDFYGRCHDLNQQKLITEGPGGGTVQYLFKDSLVHEVPTGLSMLFIPVYDDKDKIIEMNLEFSYTGWAPWNETLFAHNLKIKVMELIMKGYGGNPFVDAKINETDIPVKVDGNRRMIVYIKDDRNVVVKMQDILHSKYQHSVSAEAEKK